MTIKPPPQEVSVPIVHKISELYKSLYALGKKIPKRDKFGIHLKIEGVCLDCLTLSIEAALSPRSEKAQILKSLRVKIDVMKKLIRILYEIGAINFNTYISIEKLLQEISKMATGWIAYVSISERESS